MDGIFSLMTIIPAETKTILWWVETICAGKSMEQV
jgi:hypothetical protein